VFIKLSELSIGCPVKAVVTTVVSVNRWWATSWETHGPQGIQGGAGGGIAGEPVGAGSPGAAGLGATSATMITKAKASVFRVAIASFGVGGILAALISWHFTPPRAPEADICLPLAIHIHSDVAMFQVLVSPASVGSDSFVLQLMAGDASPLPAKQATLTLSLPARGIEPLEHTAQLGADGYWQILLQKSVETDREP
jgi:hypothetical protein